MLGCTDVQPTFRKHPAFLGPFTNLVWSFDDEGRARLPLPQVRPGPAGAGYASCWS